MSEFEQRLESLSQAAGRLNAHSDALNESVEKVNQQLKKLNLGIEAWVPIGEDPQFQAVYLGYARVKGVWGLAISVGEHKTKDYQEWLIPNAPRRFRIEAVTHFHELFECLSEEADDMLKHVTEARDQALEIVAALSIEKG